MFLADNVNKHDVYKMGAKRPESLEFITNVGLRAVLKNYTYFTIHSDKLCYIYNLKEKNCFSVVKKRIKKE